MTSSSGKKTKATATKTAMKTATKTAKTKLTLGRDTIANLNPPGSDNLGGPTKPGPTGQSKCQCVSERQTACTQPPKPPKP